MDLTKKEQLWTDEMHASFLNRIEASFVNSVLLGFDSGGGGEKAKLNRYIPDSATESTRDSERRPWPTTRNLNTNKKRPLPHNDSSQDQLRHRIQRGGSGEDRHSLSSDGDDDDEVVIGSTVD